LPTIRELVGSFNRLKPSAGDNRNIFVV
jgi:hypothetical protein